MIKKILLIGCLIGATINARIWYEDMEGGVAILKCDYRPEDAGDEEWQVFYKLVEQDHLLTERYGAKARVSIPVKFQKGNWRTYYHYANDGSDRITIEHY